eukprot:augustus_masked-scaffold_4-processed-gene-9.52-mRNA-1 protein AED:0.36 eAED:0.36 QI:0/-1/0/1/-1/1/1/0/390
MQCTRLLPVLFLFNQYLQPLYAQNEYEQPEQEEEQEDFTVITDCTDLQTVIDDLIGNGLGDQVERIFCANQELGAFPDLSELNNLKEVDFQDTGLEGEIPDTIFEVVSLEYLDLSENQLSGELSAEISNLVNLQDLNIAQNQLSGEFPSEIGELNELNFLLVNPNDFQGVMPNHQAVTSDAPPGFQFSVQEAEQGSDPVFKPVYSVAIVVPVVLVGTILIIRKRQGKNVLPPPPRGSKATWGWFSLMYGRSGKMAKDRPESGWIFAEIKDIETARLEKPEKRRGVSKLPGQVPSKREKQKVRKLMKSDPTLDIPLEDIKKERQGSNRSLFAASMNQGSTVSVASELGELTTNEMIKKKKKRKRRKNKNTSHLSSSSQMQFYASKRSLSDI